MEGYRQSNTAFLRNATIRQCYKFSHNRDILIVDTFHLKGHHGINNIGRNIGFKLLFPIDL